MTCQESGCEKQALSHGWCRPHGNEPLNSGEPRRGENGECSERGCPDKAYCKGMCARHYHREKYRQRKLKRQALSKRPSYQVARGKRCSVKKCSKPAWARGWCGMHYMRWRRHGDPLITLGLGGYRRRSSKPVRSSRGCSVPDCSSVNRNEIAAAGLCPAHVYRLRKYGDPLVDIPIRDHAARYGYVRLCEFPDCGRLHSKNGFCDLHLPPRVRTASERGPGRPALQESK